MDCERVPVVAAEREDRDGLVHPAEHRLVLLEDLHDDPRMPTVGEQRLAREVEVDVAVVALPHLLHGEVEDLWGKPLSACPLHAPGGGTRAEPPRPPRAAGASARTSRAGAGARARASRCDTRRSRRGS